MDLTMKEKLKLPYKVFFYKQKYFYDIDGYPLVYWISDNIRNMFKKLKKMNDISPPKHGRYTGDNFRFLRFWWEVGLENIAFGCKNKYEALNSNKKWFPYMKGGELKKWYGNQKYLTNWYKDGLEQKFFPRSGERNPKFYFKQGITWSDISEIFGCRYLPYGFLFDVKGSCCFPENKFIYIILTILNSKFVQYIRKILNPTITFQVGDIARIPIPDLEDNEITKKLKELADRCIEIRKEDAREDETTWDFVKPLPWRNGFEIKVNRERELGRIEKQIDQLVYKLYGLTEQDIEQVERDVGDYGEFASDSIFRGIDLNNAEKTFRKDLAIRWISYAVGIALGRFEIEGIKPAPYGFLVLDKDNPDDIVDRVYQILETLLDERDVTEIINEIGGNLRKFLEKDFFYKYHLKMYRKRPIYWLFQVKSKTYGFYIFHEKFDQDTLFKLLSDYIDPKLKNIENEIEEFRVKLKTPIVIKRPFTIIKELKSSEKRTIENKIDKLEKLYQELKEFKNHILEVVNLRDDSGNTVGYRPELDDGVLINLAPLHKLILWKEPEKCWERLKKGDYDWSKTAMRYWTRRVKEKIKYDKSLAIAHGGYE